MSSIAIDSANDIVIVNNNLVIVTGRDEIAQVIRQELRLFLNEWFLDRSKGIPYFQEILKKNPDPANVDAIFKNKILSIPGVIELVTFSLDLTLRKLTLNFSVRTEEGIISFEEVL